MTEQEVRAKALECAVAAKGYDDGQHEMLDIAALFESFISFGRDTALVRLKEILAQEEKAT